MSAQKAASWAYCEQFVTEPEVIETARRRGEELGCVPVGVGVGAALRTIAASTGARAVVEIGTGAGVSGLWLMEGMPADGILTTIDIEAMHQRAAKEAYAAAGIAHQRTRVITGRALDVLDRMTDGAYDIALVDGDKDEYPAYVEQATRLLRQGGVMVIDNMLWHDKVADPAARDETTRTLRDLGKSVRDDTAFTTTLLPVGDGLLVAIKR
ncbi:O-methyltransferase [Lapillicoccus sp.]|uniref:O-methyltransferase n=1 Tax=Lapillicoccus sp. TaxID=1909287 RepID=UPI0039830967